MALLGVNIDHVATLRQQRRELSPDPVAAALACEKAGADSIVAHLREDRRHIQDHDVARLKRFLRIRFNLEMAIHPEIVDIACRVKPDQVTLVPERRQELTTEGGLDVVRNFKKLKDACAKIACQKIDISLFIDPDKAQVDRTVALGVETIEFHTGMYAKALTSAARVKELKKLVGMSAYARSLGLTVNAGHGLKYDNTLPIAQIPGMHELNIGHSIISRALDVGLKNAVREMRKIARSA
ncbi:MAG: pyridoxine 5'-phosphate synthase [Candidatus Omnitrophica bacterium]|nr:pyridoxine 5'-phosphate synthase [Candidatus Omnitrophota bacterium]